MSDLPAKILNATPLSPSSHVLSNKTYPASDDDEHPAGKFLRAGQVSFMAVPSDWILRTHAKVAASANAIDYSPPFTNDVYLGHYYRGFRLSTDAAKNFHKILQAPPHNLTDGEHTSLRELFHNQADYRFTATSTRTEDLNGRRVLIIEGQDKLQPVRTKTIYVDSDNTGSAPQELSYVAKSELYDKYSDVAEKSFKSILWKK